MGAYRQNVRENLLLALDTLRNHKFRSFLTVLGVLIGTTTVILVASLIQGTALISLPSALSRATTSFSMPALEPGEKFCLTQSWPIESLSA